MPVNRQKPLIGLTCRWDEDKNIYYLPVEYSSAITAAGGIPVQIPLIPEIAAEIAARMDAIVLTGSPSDVDPDRYGQPRHPKVLRVHQNRDATDVAVLKHAFRTNKPILGICYGMQALNVHLGGTLVQHIPDEIPGFLNHQSEEARHEVSLEAGSKLQKWAEATQATVNSTHHQAVDKPGNGLKVVAQTIDGVIEGVEGDFREHFVIGVQWHPERIWKEEPLSARLLMEFVKAGKEKRQDRKK